MIPEQEQTVAKLRGALDAVRERDGWREISQAFAAVLHAINQTQSALEQVQRERDQAEKLAEEYRLRLPTTAQAIVYQSLLNKYEALEKERDELQARFLASEAAGAKLKTLHITQMAAFLAERERHVKALEEIRTLKEGAGPCARAWVIAQEALKETK